MGRFRSPSSAAYRQAPTPFPPAFPVVDAPIASAPPPRDARGAGPTAAQLDALGRESNGRFALSILALLLALIGARTWLRGKKIPSPGAAGASSEESGSSRLSTHDLLRLIFLASGAAALIYEVVWFHLLRLVIGASALSVGIVLASFMGGMFLGSLFFARSRFAPATPAARLCGAGDRHRAVRRCSCRCSCRRCASSTSGWSVRRARDCAARRSSPPCCCCLPRRLMGATLPAVARRYAHGPSRHVRAWPSLYAANTTGAVLGCLLSGFYLLAVWDVWVATAVAAALNFARWRLGSPFTGRTAPARPGPDEQWTLADGDVASRTGARAAGDESCGRSTWPSGLSGLTALGAQVIWTRLLTLLFGATVYAFAIILAVFLAGLGLGSACGRVPAAARPAPRPRAGLEPARAGAAPCCSAAESAGRACLPYASPPASTPLGALHGLHVLRAVAVILPAAVLWGMSFPLRAGCRRHPATATPGRSSGYVYASNTLGAIVGRPGGQLLGDPVVRDRGGPSRLWSWPAAVSAAALFRVHRAGPRRLGAGAAPRPHACRPPWALASGAVAAAFLPGLSTGVPGARPRTSGGWMRATSYPYVSEGAASTVAVHVAPDGYRNFHVSGRVEASNNPNDMRLQRLLGHLSALAHPHPESVLVVGLGAGVTAGALSLHPEVKRIVICEIEPRVVGAAKQFAPENYDVLKNPKRGGGVRRRPPLSGHHARDTSTSSPRTPSIPGCAATRSCSRASTTPIVRARLKPGGIATQWVPAVRDQRAGHPASRCQTFMDAFPERDGLELRRQRRGYDVVLLGAARRLAPGRLTQLRMTD